MRDIQADRGRTVDSRPRLEAGEPAQAEAEVSVQLERDSFMRQGTVPQATEPKKASRNFWGRLRDGFSSAIKGLGGGLTLALSALAERFPNLGFLRAFRRSEPVIHRPLTPPAPPPAPPAPPAPPVVVEPKPEPPPVAPPVAPPVVQEPAAPKPIPDFPPAIAHSFPRRGSRGADVKLLQNRLNESGFPVGTADGSFGQKTSEGLKAFQAAHGLGQTGVVDTETWAKLHVTYEKPPAPPPKPKPAPVQPTQPQEPLGNVPPQIARVFDLVNAERAKAGLPPVKMIAGLNRASTDKSQDMIDRNYFDHVDPDGHDQHYWMKRHGVDSNYTGENIAYGQRDADEVMKSWMESPGHRANILNPKFKEIGVGMATKPDGTIYWTQQFTN